MPQVHDGYGSEAHKQQPRSPRGGILGRKGQCKGQGCSGLWGAWTTEAHTVDPCGFTHRVYHFTPAEILTSKLKWNQMLQNKETVLFVRLGGSVKNCTLRKSNMAPTQPAQSSPAGTSAEQLRLPKRCKQGQARPVLRPLCHEAVGRPPKGFTSGLVLGPFLVSGQAWPRVWACGSAPRSHPSSALWDHGVRPRLAPLEGQVPSGWRFAVTVWCLVWWAQDSQRWAAWRFEQASPSWGPLPTWLAGSSLGVLCPRGSVLKPTNLGRRSLLQALSSRQAGWSSASQRPRQPDIETIPLCVAGLSFAVSRPNAPFKPYITFST